MSHRTVAERPQMEAMLDEQRAEICALLDDVTEEEAGASLVPSLTTLLGLVKHATFVEQVWFHHRMACVSRAEVGIPDTVDESFELTPSDTIESVRAGFVQACAHSREIAAAHELDEVFDWNRGEVSMRWVYLHLIREYARHAGHGDILAEQLRARRA